MKNILAIFVLTSVAMNCFADEKKHPTIVLVHGALLTSSSWAPVQSNLQNNGYNVVTVDVPGRVDDNVKPGAATLQAAVAKVCKVVAMQSDPVLLGAHSQGGAIITEATKYCGANIKALVYITAVIPIPGEKAFDLLSQQDNQNFDKIAPIDSATGLAIPNLNSPIKKYFMADANDIDAKRAINDMVAEPIVIADAALSYNQSEFNNIPKYYIKTSRDKIISAETQDKYIKRQVMRRVFTVDTGHSPFVSQPAILAKYLSLIDNQLST